jgi:hypothetical protein
MAAVDTIARCAVCLVTMSNSGADQEAGTAQTG